MNIEREGGGGPICCPLPVTASDQRWERKLGILSCVGVPYFYQFPTGKEEAPTQWPSFMDPTHYQEAFAQQLKMMHLPQNDPTMDATIQAMLYQNPALHQHLQYMWLQQQQQQQTMMRMHQEYVNRAMPMAPVEMMNYPQQPIAPVEHEGLPAPPQFPFLFIPPLAPEDQRQQQFQPPSQKPRSQAIPIVPPKASLSATLPIPIVPQRPHYPSP